MTPDRAAALQGMNLIDEPTAQRLAPPPAEMKPAFLPLANQPAYQDPNAAPTLVSDMAPPQTYGMDPYAAAQDSLKSSPVLGALKAQESAIRQAANVGTTQAVKEASYLETANQLQKDQAARDEAFFAKKFAAQEEAMGKLMGEQEALDRQRTSAPQDFWADKSTGQKILAGIGLFLGAAGGHLRGGTNTFVTTLNQAIDRDLEKQKADLASKQQGLDKKRTLLGDMNNIFGDQRIAMQAARATAFKGVENDLAIIASKYKGQEIQAKAQMALAEVGMVRAQAEEEVKSRYAQLAAYKDGGINPMAMDEKTAERYVKGYGLARNTTVAKELDEVVVSAENAKQGIARLMQLSNKTGSSLSLQDRAEADTVRNMLAGALRLEILGPGVVTEAERAILMGLVADPTKVFQLKDVTRTRLMALQKRIEAGVKAKMKQSIVVPFGGDAATKEVREIDPKAVKPILTKGN